MPWLGAILLAGAAAFGRLVAVNLLPNTILVLTVLLAVRSGAFATGTAPLGWDDVFSDFKVDTGSVLLLILAVFSLGVLLQPFTILTVRLLEGYWGDAPVGRRLAALAAGWHRRRLRSAKAAMAAEQTAFRQDYEAVSQVSADGRASEPIDKQVQRIRGRRKRRQAAKRGEAISARYPPNEDEVLPTALGNALRASERRSGERYHLSTVHTLDRVYQYMSERLSTAYDSSVDALDAAAAMATTSAISAIVAGLAFYNDPDLRWIAVVLAVVSFLAYRGAIVAAALYGRHMDMAFDLHRFDLIRALHLDLPRDTDEERVVAERVNAFLSSVDAKAARQRWSGTRYWHYDVPVDPHHSGASENNDSAPTGYL